MKIDLYADISCPWCLLGHHRLDRVLAKRFPDLKTDVEHQVALLSPDCPPEGIDIGDIMRARGLDPAAIRARPEAEARSMGLALELQHQPRLYPTLRGHTLIRLARQRGTQHALARALAEANFAGRNINDIETLADIAAAHGFMREEATRLVQDDAELGITRQAAEATAAKGIRSVPHFIFNGTVSFSGNQGEENFVAAIEQAMGIAGIAAR
mgnify:CR=1 FL=1